MGIPGDEGRTEKTATLRSLRVSTHSGRVEIVAEDRSDIVVSKGGREIEPDVDPETGRLTVVTRSSTVRALVPVGTDVVIGTSSGRVKLLGRLGAVAVTTGSGRVSVAEVERFEGRVGAGRVEVTTCHGPLRVDSAVGRVAVGSATDVHISSIAARVTVEEATGLVRIRSVSGRVDATLVPRGALDVAVQTVSGRVTLAVPVGCTPAQRFSTKSGSIHSDLDGVGTADGGTISARTVNGAIRVRVD